MDTVRASARAANAPLDLPADGSDEFGPTPKVVFRLIGSRRIERWGGNLTGHDRLAFLPERERAVVGHQFRATARERNLDIGNGLPAQTRRGAR